MSIVLIIIIIINNSEGLYRSCASFVENDAIITDSDGNIIIFEQI